MLYQTIAKPIKAKIKPINIKLKMMDDMDRKEMTKWEKFVRYVVRGILGERFGSAKIIAEGENT